MPTQPAPGECRHKYKYVKNLFFGYTTKQDSQVSCLAHNDFAAFDKRMQLIGGSSCAETEQISRLLVIGWWWVTGINVLPGRGSSKALNEGLGARPVVPSATWI